jgi:transposase InsO family protein
VLLDLVHSDLMQLNTLSLGGACYLFTLLDDRSKKLWIYFLKRKSDTFQHFREWQALVERQSGLNIKALRSDNGGEYTAGQFQLHLRSEGIASQFSVAYTPQQNGAAERLSQKVQDAVRTMLVQSGLSSGLWAEAYCNKARQCQKGLKVEIVHGDSPRQCQKGLICLGGQGAPYILL